jgi:large subunit ribosomal protein L21
MLAIVKISGQQFKVQEGQSLYVPHLPGKTGDKVSFISDLVQGDKVIAFKMKRRKGFRKKHGHRTHYTRIKIESIA